ncbi:MAG: T6SS immunity protein Tdi1 domain-containing protein [Planctomycetota bacterium]|jgi:hypothetical protein
MKITWNELNVKFEQGSDDLLSDWRWLIGDAGKPILVTSLGDAFVQESDGSVHWLNVEEGSYTKVATSSDDFQAQLKSSENIEAWFVPQLVGDILATGISAGPNQCFSFKKPPVLGGEYEPGNFEPTDISVHFSILGQIHQKVKDLPDGTPISNIDITDIPKE